MILVDSNLSKATIVIDNVGDEIRNCRLTECTIVSRVEKILFLKNHIITEQILQQRGRKPSERMPVITCCVLTNCKLPEGYYEQNYIEKLNRSEVRNT